jgi:invasion protein IalB
MLKYVFTAATLLSLLFAGVAVAQSDTEADTADQAEAQTDTSEANPEESPLDLGTPVNEGPVLGARYSKEKFGDWDLACIKTEAEQDP